MSHLTLVQRAKEWADRVNELEPLAGQAYHTLKRMRATGHPAHEAYSYKVADPICAEYTAAHEQYSNIMEKIRLQRSLELRKRK